MIVAVATDDGKVISSHFGRTKGFAIFEIDENGKIDRSYLENNFTDHALGFIHQDDKSHSEKHEKILRALIGCNVVISNGMGKKIYGDLMNAGIKPIITKENSVDIAMNLLMENKLDDHTYKACSHDH
jgi:predicted Fe-Mo cluster-binding NifX family protein